jgi:hypothetical protein
LRHFPNSKLKYLSEKAVDGFDGSKQTEGTALEEPFVLAFGQSELMRNGTAFLVYTERCAVRCICRWSKLKKIK